MRWFPNSSLTWVAHKVLYDSVERRLIIICKNLRKIRLFINHNKISDKLPSISKNPQPTIFPRIPAQQRRHSNPNKTTSDHIRIIYFKIAFVIYLFLINLCMIDFRDNLSVCIFSILYDMRYTMDWWRIN